MPTDTVYGLAADPFSAEATDRLFAAKRRPRQLALPVLVGDRDQAGPLVEDWPPAAEALAQGFWPGPLTIVVAADRRAGLRLGARPGTVGLRQPDHPAALALLRLTGPLAVTSANLSGDRPALTVPDAVRQFGRQVAVYVDAGRAAGGVASTVVDLSGGSLRLVREGGIGRGQLVRALTGGGAGDGAADGAGGRADGIGRGQTERALAGGGAGKRAGGIGQTTAAGRLGG
jgi:tRNA threonylcarbamoyl adenosine modification protein (Sua5/YciO/YrdC/YwlC family)